MLLYLFNDYCKKSIEMYQWVKYSDHVSLEMIVLGNFNRIVWKILTIKSKILVVLGYVSWFLNYFSIAKSTSKKGPIGKNFGAFFPRCS